VGWEEYPGLWYVGSAPVPSTDDPRCNWSNDLAAPSREGHPINCVDWFTALEFCAWDGGRLPTESEWEYLARLRRDGAAASLPAPRVYPWGDDAPRQSCDATARARWLGDACPLEDGARTHRVGSYADAGGIHDLAGNVAEWTIDVFNSVDATFLGGFARATYWAQGGFFAHEATEHAASAPRVVRGGSWRDTRPAVLRAASRSLASYRSRLSTIGFRCVRSVSPPGGM